MLTSAPRILVLDRGDELAAQVRAAAGLMDPTPEVVASGGITGLEELVGGGGFSVVVAGPSLASRAGLRRLARFHEQAPFASIVLTISDRPDVSLRELVQVGPDDLLVLPAADAVIASALARVSAIAARRRTAADPTARSRRRGRVLAVASATGGCGKTFFAANLALFLAQRPGEHDRRVVLVDLDLQFGEVTTALRLRPDFTISDTLAGEGEDGAAEFADRLGEVLLDHGRGFSVLAAPRDPAEADAVTPADVTRVLEALRTQADYVVVDCPTGLNEVMTATLDVSDEVLVLATLDHPSLRNLESFVETLAGLQVPTEAVSLVLNKAEADVGITVEEAERSAPLGFSAVLPYDREVTRSINMGVPLLASSPRSEAARALAGALASLFPQPGAVTSAAPAAPQPRSPWTRLLPRSRRHPAASPVAAAVAAPPDPPAEVSPPAPATPPAEAPPPTPVAGEPDGPSPAADFPVPVAAPRPHLSRRPLRRRPLRPLRPSGGVRQRTTPSPGGTRRSRPPARPCPAGQRRRPRRHVRQPRGPPRHRGAGAAPPDKPKAPAGRAGGAPTGRAIGCEALGPASR